MNISKYIAFAAVAAVATGAFAVGADNAMIQFSTTADYYADGTPVKDGEWYALCWSPDGVFEGITADYKPLDAANDKVFMMASLAKNGACQGVMFQLPNAPKKGKYCVLMLDTREGGTGAVAGGETQPERAANLAIASGSYEEVSSSSTSTTVGGLTPVASANWDKPIDTATATTAKIAAIEVKDAKIVVTVDDMIEGVRYNVMSGETPTEIGTYEIAKPAPAAKTSDTIEVDKKGDAKFLKLTHEPMVRPNAE